MAGQTKTSVSLFCTLLVTLAFLKTTHGTAAGTLTAEDQIIRDPVKMYKIYTDRLRKHGANAPFPEFKPAIDQILVKLNSTEFKEKIARHPDLNFELTEVLTYIAHLNLDFSFDDEANYPYPQPFQSAFPYRPTLDAIENAIRLIDKVERLTNPRAMPLYHFDRYLYHRHSLVADPDVLVFPTIRELTFEDLIRVRSVPIGFVGVVTETIRIDRHWNSPIDFWYHDMNHVRRMVAYIALSAKKQGFKTRKQKLAFYKQMDDFLVNTLLPNMTEPPAGASEEEIAIRRLVRVIFFEILHETALTAESHAILEDLLRGSKVKEPFEMVVSSHEELANVRKDLESERTPSGNLVSGVAAKSMERSGKTLIVRYFHDRSLGLLANIYNKLTQGFYDSTDNPLAEVAPIQSRNPDDLAKAAMRVMSILGYANPPDTETLKNLILSKEGMPELFRVYPTLEAVTGPQSKRMATDPLSPDEAVAQIQKIGKKVYTLFGYADLEYENKPEVMAQIELELRALDPATTIINIGATEEGIGAAYEVAKKLGFETMGVVSNRALNYNGKFSSDVDRIYIINDVLRLWGGYIPGTKDAAPVSTVFLRVSNTISAYGGGEHTAMVMREAVRRGGIDVKFTPAEMSHKKAKSTGKSVDVKGPAQAAWENILETNSSLSSHGACVEALTAPAGLAPHTQRR